MIRTLVENPTLRRLKWAALIVAIALPTALLFRFDPAGSPFFPKCLTYTLTGLYCPGCGTARALHQLAHGHVGKALRLNPLMVLALPFLAYGLISDLVWWVKGRPLPHVFMRPAWIWLIFWVLIAYTLLRNLPYYPLTLLAPSNP